ncbi:MAG: neutral/alkaline non-lysosomal ceramidase N-terminal domain-containing protein [Verrucomicrobia bacterium]|nr:neutral/alkaline non-lysosomal ceramidase N-terminal domain-containing protein [Verrucomicrobiota bacterium]
MPARFAPALIVALLLGSLNALSGAAPAALPYPWKAGVAKATVTPTEPIWLAGFGSRTRPSEGVRQDLFVRAVAVQDADGTTAVLTTLDLVGIERELAETIATQCEQRFGLKRDRLILNVSHTHSGPVAGLVLMPLYELDATQREVVRRYTQFLLERTVATIGAAIADLAPARLEFGQSLAGIAVNRRRARQRSLPGPVDPDVPVLAVRNPAGALRAIVVGYATHATTLNDYLINGDWPGYAVAEIEREHPGATALFVQGCGADANALPRRDEELTRAYSRILAAAAAEVLRNRMTPLAGPLRTTFNRVDVPFQTPPTRAQLESRLQDSNRFIRLHAQRLLEELARDGRLPDRYPYPVQVWQFGRGMRLVALGGEVVADYALRLKREHGFDNTWVAGYSNDILAYIPSRRVLEEGGYEGGEAMIYFGRPAPFTPEVEETIVAEVRRLIRHTDIVPAGDGGSPQVRR